MSTLLWFLLFLSVPIVVHLFNFRKAKKFYFTNVRFISQVSSESKSKTRLKHLVILSCRVLFILFTLISFFLFLKPFDSNEIGEVERTTQFYVDNSISNLGKTGFNYQSKIFDLFDGLNFREALLLTNEFLPFSNVVRSKEEVLYELSNINPSYVDRNFDDVLARLISHDHESYIISDFQTFKDANVEEILNDTLSQYHLIYNQHLISNNAYVDTVWLSKDMEDYTQSILSCVLKGVESDAYYVVKLLDLEGRQISSAIANSESNFAVDFSISRNDMKHSYTIKISGDDFIFDNTFYLTLPQSGRPRISIISKDENEYLSMLFEKEDLFELNILDPSSIDYELIQSSDFVILNGYTSLPRGIIGQNLDATFLVIPDENIDLVSYESELGITFDRGTNTDKYEVEVNANYLFYGVFNINQSEITMPKASALYIPKNNFSSLLSLRNGNVYLSKVVNKEIYFLTSPLNEGYSDLMTHAIFLPLMYRIADLSTDVEGKLFTYVGEYLKIPGIVTDTPPKVVSPEVEVVPEFFNQNEASLVRVPDGLAPGFYQVLIDSDTIRHFGLNLPKSESIFDGYSYDELERRFEDADHVNFYNIEEFDSQVLKAQSSENSIWKYALILAVVFLLLETALHNYLK